MRCACLNPKPNEAAEVCSEPNLPGPDPWFQLEDAIEDGEGCGSLGVQGLGFRAQFSPLKGHVGDVKGHTGLKKGLGCAKLRANFFWWSL